MRNSHRIGLCTLLLLMCCLTVSARPRLPQDQEDIRPQITTLMYLTSRAASIESFRDHADQISVIAPQSFSMDARGFVTGEVPPEVLQIARDRRVAVMPLVTNRGFSQSLMHSVLDKRASRERVIRYLVYYALRDGYIGFQFDCEHINHAYRKRFTSFLGEASREFHKYGLVLSVALVGRHSDGPDSDSPGGFENWSGVYDYAAIARVADFVSIMAYPQHAAFSDPGPLAGLPWVRKILDYTLNHVPARKISLGVPTYGLRWTENGRRWKTSTAAWPDVLPQLLQTYTPEWDPTEKAHYFQFTSGCDSVAPPPEPAETDDAPASVTPSSDDRTVIAQWTADESEPVAETAPAKPCNRRRTRNVVWFEDAESLAPKLQLAVSNNLGWGISGWVLGMEDPGFWLMLHDYRVTHPSTPRLTGSLEERSRSAARRVGLKKAELAAASSAGM